MNETFDSYTLIIETDETTALILGEALADWNLGVHLPDDAGLAILEIFCATRAEAKSRLRVLRALAPQAHFGPAIIKPASHNASRREATVVCTTDRVIVCIRQCV